MQKCGVVAGSACAASSVLAARRAASWTRSLVQPARSQRRAVRRLMAVRAEEQQRGAAEAEEPELAAEQLLRRRKGSKASSSGGGGVGSKEGSKAKPTVIAPVRDQVYGDGPQTPAQKAENSVVALLATLFFVILLEGIFLAGSGFMSESLDAFAQDVVFPAFTPTLGVFLAISTGYGLWKTRAAPTEGQ